MRIGVVAAAGAGRPAKAQGVVLLGHQVERQLEDIEQVAKQRAPSGPG